MASQKRQRTSREIVTNKDKINKICEILEINSNVLEMPRNGFKQESMNTCGRSYRRGKRIVHQLLESICDLVSPSNSQFKENIMKKDSTSEEKQAGRPATDTYAEQLESNAADLIFRGSPNTCRVVKALLAKSFTLTYMKRLLKAKAEDFVDESCYSDMKKKAIVGKVHFKSLKNNYDLLSSGNDLKKNKYSYRLDAAKISTVIQFVQGSLCLKAGVVRDVKFDGYLFKNLPVYERGGRSIKALKKSYDDSFDKEDRVGWHTFLSLIQLLTRRGESKAGLSTYYIQLRYSASVFVRMMKRIMDFEYTTTEQKNEVKEKCTNLVKDWEEIQMYIMWEYTDSHLEISSQDRAHCCTYALDPKKSKQRRYNTQCCGKCNSCLDFFDTNVKNTLDKVKSLVATNENDSEELGSMYRALPLLKYAVKHYMAHRLRAKVQFVAIEKAKKALQRNPSILYITIDHKQKILQIRFREGQVEYYGKKGMSDLGAHIMQWVIRKLKEKMKNGETVEVEVGGFEYSFVNFIFKNYSGQDHVQVASAIEQIISHVHEKFPEVKEIIIQSDNASCFASQELIPFIYHTNKESRIKKMPIISKWIFTEAQTGRGKLDTHFSYLNKVFRSYVEDGNNILIEEDILDALEFNDGVAGTTGILLDCSKLTGDAISKKFKSKKVQSRATHEIRWHDNKAEIYESSGITEPEIVSSSTLNLHKKNDLDVVLERSVVSSKPPLFTKLDESDLDSRNENLAIDIESVSDDKTVNTVEKNSYSKLKRKRNYDDCDEFISTEAGAILSSSLVLNESNFVSPTKKRNFDSYSVSNTNGRDDHTSSRAGVVSEDVISSRAQAVRDALKASGIIRKNHNNDTKNHTLVDKSADSLKPGWAMYPGNSPYKMKCECLVKLKELYDIGKKSKKQKITSERAHKILMDTILSNDWEQQLVVTVPKIKSFFQKTPAKMSEAIEKAKI